jgi:ABC-type oligopeptide transport system ATPase subunit
MPKYVGQADAPTRKSAAAKSWENKPVTIVAEGLSKYFKLRGRVIKAVDRVNFTFTEEQFIAITGPSGAGKSTLLYILSRAVAKSNLL